MLNNIFKILIIFILGMGGGALVFYQLQYQSEPGPVYIIEKKEIIIQENTALENAVEKTKKTVINIRAKLESGEILEGSGLIVTSDGLAVTLNSLIPQGSALYFYINGSSTSYQILKRDSKENLALIKVGRIDLPTLSFADLEKIKLGERVFLVGVGVANEGIIRSFSKDFIETNIFEKNIISGSPLFDIEGSILGINTIDEEGRVIAIPISKIKKFIGL
ncbi:MAG: trypsin-like peptidase domain-containing protein [Patescibacteria group bacterium]